MKQSRELKAYSKYLMDQIPSLGSIFENLNSFYEQGRINGLLAKNTPVRIKIEMLEIYKVTIEEHLKVQLDSYDEFVNKMIQ